MWRMSEGGAEGGATARGAEMFAGGRLRTSTDITLWSVTGVATQQVHWTQFTSQGPWGSQQSCRSSAQTSSTGRRNWPRWGPSRTAINRMRRSRFTNARIPGVWNCAQIEDRSTCGKSVGGLKQSSTASRTGMRAHSAARNAGRQRPSPGVRTVLRAVVRACLPRSFLPTPAGRSRAGTVGPRRVWPHGFPPIATRSPGSPGHAP